VNQVPTDAQALAEASAEAMFSRDSTSQSLGMEIVEVRPGYARLTMTVRSDMVNGHDISHGGLIFSLADSAFAFACNSYNRATVALSATIEFLAPGRLGDLLMAEAQEVALGNKTGVYDVVVTNQDGQRIALFRGKSYRLQGTVIQEDAS
jgi:acyl-CoA thioesterase